MITYNDLSKVNVNKAESKGDCGTAIGKTLNVQQHHLDQVKALGLQTTTATKKDRTLTDYNCGLGLATA